MQDLPELPQLAWAEVKPDGSMRSISWSAPSEESLEIAAIEGAVWHALVTEASARQAVLMERERLGGALDGATILLSSLSESTLSVNNLRNLAHEWLEDTASIRNR